MLKKAKSSLLLGLLIVSSLFTSSFNPTRNASNGLNYLFFDLGEVLISTSKSKSFAKNILTFLKFVLKHGKPASTAVKKRLFELIDHQSGYPPRGTAVNNGEQMPALMCDWLEGKIESAEFIKIITDINPADPFFKSRAEGQFLISTAKLFEPKNLVEIHNTTKLLELFLACKKYAPERVCILSNWDRSSIKFLKDKFPQIFSGLANEQVIFSAECGCKKPDEAIYQFASEKLGVLPSQCILIDDQYENIAAAQRCGWRGIWHQNHQITSNSLMNCYNFWKQ